MHSCGHDTGGLRSRSSRSDDHSTAHGHMLRRVVYYESLKRALKTKTIYGYQCDERLKTNVEESIVVYYESLKRALKTKTIYGYRCDERLKTNVEESTRLACPYVPCVYQNFFFFFLETYIRLIDPHSAKGEAGHEKQAAFQGGDKVTK